LVDSVDLPGGTKVTAFSLIHPGGSLGFRLSWHDRAMAYVTDTTASADAPYVEQIRGVDLLVHECNFPDSMPDLAAKTGHSCTTQVLEVARAASVKRLVLIHLNPLADSDEFLGLEQARHIFPAVETGYDGMEIEF
jgi:ribonuclease BN (tRNA processing enzyme)